MPHLGDLPLSTKVDRQMRDFLDEEASRCGLTRSEVLRRVLTDYKNSRADQLNCPSCGETIHIDPCNASDT